jgi:transcriptional regulator with XRE-family HTH domain
MKNLRAIRVSRGLTQKALGKKTGITQAAISRIEAGLQEPGYRTVLRIAVALGCEPEELIGSPNGGPKAPPVGASMGAADAA